MRRKAISVFLMLAVATVTLLAVTPSDKLRLFAPLLTNAGLVDLATGIVTGTLTVGKGGTGATTFSSNAPVIGAGSSALTVGSRSGNTTTFATTSGTLTSGDCAKFDASGNLVANGSACGSGGSGTVTTTGSPSSGNLAKFSGSTSITNTDLTGDLTTSGGVATTLANSGVSAATYGDSTHVAQVAVDAKGRVTSASNVAIASSTGDWVLIATSTPSSTGVVTFSSLGSYTHLKIIWSARSTETATFSSIGVTFNSDTGANYDNQEIFISNGTSGGSQGFAGASIGGLLITGASAASNVPGSGELTIPDYRGTTFYKTLNTTYQDQRAASSGNFFWASRAGVWRNTSAITRIDLTLASGNFVSGSKFSLYGVN